MRHHLKKYAVFSFGGMLSFLYELIMTVFLTEVFHIWHMLSYAIAIITGLLLLFMFHATITFSDQISTNRLHRFYLTYLAAGSVNWFLVLLITRAGIRYTIAITGITALMSVVTYVTNRYWVFGDE